MTRVNKYIQTRLFAAMAILVIPNLSAAQPVTHDLISTGVGQHRINGDDPYIIFNAQGPVGNASHLILDLGSDLNGVPLELFFVAKDDLFDPYFKLSFTATSFPSALKLPKAIELTSSSRLRLDVTRCAECSVNITTLPRLSNNPKGITQIEPVNVQNGIKKLNKKPRSISSNGWRLNDLAGDVANFEVSGTDPFLVSPRLSISTSEFAGAYFKLMAPSSEEAWNDYQLFYQTERHAFSRDASSVVRIPNRLSPIVEFMIPLGFLSTEQPSDSVLERLRLDLPNISGNWSLIEARLVHQDQELETKHLIPAQLVQIKQQRATRLALVKKALINISSDLSFLIAYLLVLTLTGALFLRAYRSNK